ncbi:type II secretion system minor pseudopilin GspI [Simiduia sp. 21SJ11W-1]|uniref:type II secretion system minor pseudopilin GspI n=1 Tax=Simiduia sp. 21SJ11W-1 TaxID=2909669 RepID=UPI00209C82C1|nr:type II secretion system minor pseudopilin GspI [Simiduia sp. 21SJ11W-1]UTA47881.1 type II secretion system minor pseudopilin GspI [Simiduia sp. 21SJ11W-1]
MNPERGFSLVEVLVALMIVGLALPALLGQMQSQSDAQGSLRNKTLALYVAQNKIAEYRLRMREPNFTLSESETGEVEMAGVRWHWRSTSTKFPDIGARQVEVFVGLKPDDSLSSVMAVFSE